MDSSIARSGRPLDMYGALMRGYQGAMVRQQDQQQQEDRATLIGALDKRYGALQDQYGAGYGELSRLAPEVLQREQEQSRLQFEQQKWGQEQFAQGAPMLLKMTQALKGVPSERREQAAQEMLQTMARINPTVARELMFQLDDISDEGLDGMLTSLSAYAPEPEETALMTNAKAAGLVPGSPEYNQFIRDNAQKGAVEINLPGQKIADSLPKPPQGYMYRMDSGTGDVILNNEGRPELVEIEGAPLSEGERRDTYAAELLQSFESDLSDVMADYPEYDPASGWNIPGSVTNWLASPGARQYRAIADEWTTNTVFLRSGATAREEEKEAAFKNYFPQPGDDPATVRRKDNLRRKQTERAIEKAGRGHKPEDQKKSYYVVTSEGKRRSVSWDEIVKTAESVGKTPDEVMQELEIKAK